MFTHATSLSPGGARRLSAHELGAAGAGTHAGDAARVALRLLREAGAATVKNERVARDVPRIFRQKLAQLDLDVFGIALSRPAQALREALHMRVDDRAFGRCLT